MARNINSPDRAPVGAWEQVTDLLSTARLNGEATTNAARQSATIDSYFLTGLTRSYIANTMYGSEDVVWKHGAHHLEREDCVVWYYQDRLEIRWNAPCGPPPMEKPSFEFWQLARNYCEEHGWTLRALRVGDGYAVEAPGGEVVGNLRMNLTGAWVLNLY